MKAFLASPAGRLMLSALGLLLLALLIWFAGPYVAFAEHHPWEGVVGRLVTILVLVLLWSLVLVWRLLRAARAARELTSGLAAQSPASDAGRAGGAAATGAVDTRDAAALRERFVEAMAALRKAPGGRGLEELPWYLIIGPPGTGKTTLIRNSGLKFPLASSFGKDAIRGVGGTRHCDWWFTDEAILLDTAGRYTTQDSNAAADRGGWLAFLDLLTRFRKRRPINGILVAFSAAELATLGESELERHAETIRRRLDEVYAQLHVTLPVYFLVTKCDLIAGFTEYFDDLDQAGRAQVWGFTAALADSERGEAVRALGGELAALCGRLADRVTMRLDQERNAARRAALLAFPQQVAALVPRVERLVGEVFQSGRFERQILFRGLYLTSGTQEGTPIDRLMGAVSREFGLDVRLAVPPVTGGRAYFIERLLRAVVFAEAGLVGTNRRAELRKALLHTAGYAACAVLGLLAVVALAVSDAANSAYVADVGRAAAPLPELLARPPPPGGAEAVLAPLDALGAVAAVADRNRGAVPWRMGFGLYQGRSLGGAARDAYVREIDRLLVPRLAAALREDLVRAASQPEALFEYLKAYLMLTDTRHFEPDALAAAAAADWAQRYPQDPSVPERLGTHLTALLGAGQGVSSVAPDAETIARARASLVGLTPARLVYARIHRLYSADPAKGLKLDVAAGLDSEKVLMRRSGVPLATPLAYLYTKPAFQEIASVGAAKAAAGFAKDAWVFGSSAEGLRDAARLPFDVLAVYESDYIDAWDHLLGDITLRPLRGGADTAEALRILSSANSPLRSLVKTVADNTLLVKPDAAASASPLAQLAANPSAALAGAGAAVQGALSGTPAVPPGTRVTAHFKALQGAGAGVDQCIGSLAQIYQQINAGTQGFVNANALNALNQGGSIDLAKSLQSCAASLPPPLNGWVGQLSAASQAVALGQVRSQLGQKMAQSLGGDCPALVARYPFRHDSDNDLPLADFGRLFGYGGTLDGFYKDNLASLVDVRGDTWRWRDVGSASLGLSPAVLASFQRAELIREAFFRPGAQSAEVHFTLTPDTLDAEVTRFVLEIDGQTFEYRHGPARPWAGVWPGPSPGLASLKFEETSGSGPAATKQGPWAFFRLLDSAEISPQSDTRYLVTLRAGNRSMRLILEATSIRNPFRQGLLSGYRCAS